MATRRKDEDFLDRIGRLASDHAKEAEAKQGSRQTAKKEREDFLLAFQDKARNEIEETLSEIAWTLRQRGSVMARASFGDRNGDEDRVKLTVSDDENVYELLFLANPLKLRVTVHRAQADMYDTRHDPLADLNAERSPALASFVLGTVDDEAVRQQALTFLEWAIG